jgi:hypothetical protein
MVKRTGVEPKTNVVICLFIKINIRSQFDDNFTNECSTLYKKNKLEKSSYAHDTKGTQDATGIYVGCVVSPLKFFFNILHSHYFKFCA